MPKPVRNKPVCRERPVYKSEKPTGLGARTVNLAIRLTPPLTDEECMALHKIGVPREVLLAKRLNDSIGAVPLKEIRDGAEKLVAKQVKEALTEPKQSPLTRPLTNEELWGAGQLIAQIDALCTEINNGTE